MSRRAAAFLGQVMGLNLAADQIALLETRTEGWIAGLPLAEDVPTAHSNSTSGSGSTGR